MRTPACCMSAKSASHRDSGHCSGYHAVPSKSGGGAGAAVWPPTPSGSNKPPTSSSANGSDFHGLKMMLTVTPISIFPVSNSSIRNLSGLP